LFFKEGRFKYVFSDFTHEPFDGISFGIITDSEKPPVKSHLGSKKKAELIWDDLKKQSLDQFHLLEDSLIKTMKSKEEEW